jgi:hypothetical protein
VIHRRPGAGRSLRRSAGVVLSCAALALAGVGFAGCGDDDGETTTPTTEPATPTGVTGPNGGRDDQRPGQQGDAALEDDTVSPPPETDPSQLPTEPAEDSAENDVAPEPGSPEESFEQFCDQNPEACD